jgi:LPXTG-motif cell wall-anchored protein
VSPSPSEIAVASVAAASAGPPEPRTDAATTGSTGPPILLLAGLLVLGVAVIGGAVRARR